MKGSPRYWIAHDILEFGRELSPEERRETTSKYARKDDTQKRSGKRISDVLSLL